ncbi:hypothetical protein SAMD00023353_0501250 [Rosellinia necatrix]|uniref:Uncharacterized protein n=1 Tax=Rosellinia necatrix TaxID=77044 RepID=A0A1S7UKC3_ROSNE|nr:hypothetical protein SAMD00023353_0501250 [Rosellinia necatrix]
MSPDPFQAEPRRQFRLPGRRSNQRNRRTSSSSDSEPLIRCGGVYTGEHREPLREWIRRMCSEKRGPASPPRPVTPPPEPPATPSKRSGSGGAERPRTPPPPPSPECPGAPRKGRPINIRRLDLSRRDEIDEGIFLDRRANGTVARPTPDFMSPMQRSGGGGGGGATPGRSSPLRQSWSPDQLYEVDARLHKWLRDDSEAHETDDDEARLLG